jgi:CubicO group peptidase (beta-lactamase class C family)
LKNFLYAILLLALLYGCKEASSGKETTEDSLHYYPPTPAQLDKQAFRKYFRELTAFFDTSLLSNKSFNGSILVAKDGNILYEKYVGYRDLRLKDTLSESTTIHLASASKPFTAVAVLRMVQDGKLSLNDTLTKFFPNFPYAGITIKMLLNHRSGLPNYVNFMGDKKKWDIKTQVTNAAMLQYLYDKKPERSFPPNKNFSYSNTNYVLLAMIIEKISGQPFPAYMKEHLFAPLQMKDSYIFTLDSMATATASYKYDGIRWEYDHLEGTYGDKNMFSTPQDMLRFDQALYTDQLLTKAMLDSAFTAYSNERPSVHNYGLGFRLLNLSNGKKVVYHFGRWHGFNAVFARLIDEKATIIILGNKYNRGIYGRAHEAYDIFGDYSQKGIKQEEETESTAPTSGKKKTP